MCPMYVATLHSQVLASTSGTGLDLSPSRCAYSCTAPLTIYTPVSATACERFAASLSNQYWPVHLQQPLLPNCAATETHFRNMSFSPTCVRRRRVAVLRQHSSTGILCFRMRKFRRTSVPICTALNVCPVNVALNT